MYLMLLFFTILVFYILESNMLKKAFETKNLLVVLNETKKQKKIFANSFFSIGDFRKARADPVFI